MSWKWCHGIVACGGLCNIIIFGHVTLYVNGDVGCTCICMWQSAGSCVLARRLAFDRIVYNTLSPFVSPYVNVEVSSGWASGLVKKCKMHTHWNCVCCQ